MTNKLTIEQMDFINFICEVNTLKKRIIEGKDKSDLSSVYVFVIILVLSILFKVYITN